MLDKVKLLAIVGFALTILAFIVPDVAIPQGIDVAIVSVALFVASYFKGESAESIARYVAKR